MMTGTIVAGMLGVPWPAVGALAACCAVAGMLGMACSGDGWICPTWNQPGRCICHGPLPAMSRWANAGRDWANTECSSCHRHYVDEDDEIAVYTDHQWTEMGS